MSHFSPQEKSDIEKYFGSSVEELEQSEFEGTLRKLRAKYHPDNFEQFENEAVREMATEKFQAIEKLAEKMKAYFDGTLISAPKAEKRAHNFMHPDAIFAGKRLKIEVMTSNKDLKYHLFGTGYRWLTFGDSFQIPETEARIHIDEDHRGHRVGFRESIRMYLTFDESDSISSIVNWLYPRIVKDASTLLVVGEAVEVNAQAIETAIKKHTLLRIGGGE